jgi:hypothetical protein
MTKQIWKIYCEEDKHPGMWQRWFKNQCVAVGWAGKWNYHLEGESKLEYGWGRARKLLQQIKIGDLILVSLKDNRVGRIGEVTGLAIGDTDWDPLVPKSKDEPDGEKGRRIFVRWDFNIGPEDRDLVVALPPEARLSSGERRPTIAKISLQKLDILRTAMNDSANWVGLASEFSYEKSLSDYISAYPYRLEDGLLPHPNKKVRERVFSDSKRLDVLLEDKFGKAVIVECKQNQPTVQDVQQLQHYLNKFKDEEGQEARGILVHGGARKLREEVRQAAKKKPTVELVQFSVGVDFSKSE